MLTLKYIIGQDQRKLTPFELHDGDTFDLSKDPDVNKNKVQAMQYNSGMDEIFLELYEDQKDNTGALIPFDLSGANIMFEGWKPDGTYIVDSDIMTPISLQQGQCRINLPDQAFAVYGSYKQAFFRIYRDNKNIATLEFTFNVRADMVQGQIKSVDWIGPVHEILEKAKEDYESHKKSLDDAVSNAIAEYTKEMNTLKALGTSVDTSLSGLLQKIKDNNLFTQAEADAFKQVIINTIKTKTINIFSSVEEMRNSSNSLTEGMTVKTLGYYQSNDAGAATYHVTSKPNTSRHYETLGNSLYAELIDDHYNLAMRGAKADGSEDISQIFNEAVKEALANDGDKTIRLPAGTFLLTNSVNLPIRHLTLTGENGTTLLTDTGNDPAIVLYGPADWAGVRRSIVDINFREKHDKAAGTKAVLIGDEQFIADKTPLQAAAQFAFEKCGFTNYDVGVAVGSDAYLFDFNRCSCTHLNRFIATSSQNIMNSGEKIGITDCILTACSDTVFYLENVLELHVTNSSIDSLEGGKVLYVNDPEDPHSVHLISFDNCHFEPGNIVKPIFEIAGEHTHCSLEIKNSVFWLNKVTAESLIACGDLVNTVNFSNNVIGTSEDQTTFIADNYNANITNTSLDAAVKPVAFSQNITNNHRNKFKNALLDGVTDLTSNVAYGVGNVYTIQRDDTDFANTPRITTTNAKMSIDSEVPQGMTGRSIKIDTSGQGIFNFDFMAPVTEKGILEFAFNIKSNINLGDALSCYHLSSEGNASSSFELSFSRTVQCDNAWKQVYFTSAPYKLRGEQSFAGFRLVLDKRQLGDAVTIKIYNPYVNVI